MTSSVPTPAYQGRISGRISTDIRGAMFMPLHGTCLPGTDIRSDIRGYPTISYAFRTTRQGNSWGLPRGPGRDNEAARGPLVEGLPGGRRRDEGAAHGRLFVGTARTALPDPRQNRRTVRLLV